MLVGIACLDKADVLIKFLQLVLTREIAYSGCTRTLGYIEMEGLCLYRLISLGAGIEIGKLYWRNIVLALMARNNKHIVNLRTLDACSGKFGLLSNLWLVLIKVFWKIDYRLLDELEVTCTAYDNAQCDGVVSLSLGLVELG